GPALALTAGALAYFRRWWGATRVLGGTFLSEATVRTLKFAFARARPEYALGHGTGFSFPSGHAAFGAAVAVLLVWFAARHVRGRALVMAVLVVALAWTVAMAGSRLVLGVHYLSDVVAGVGVGLAVTSLVILASLALEARVSARRG
ncbi:MAG TPA: phosphatase PAP2 family protein, partial [Candidatus Thermoplasmatota archaeon]|nr:phosphatase PAP2 family protein [Candidatus Thermoplasmatota archaeon]